MVRLPVVKVSWSSRVSRARSRGAGWPPAVLGLSVMAAIGAVAWMAPGRAQGAAGASESIAATPAPAQGEWVLEDLQGTPHDLEALMDAGQPVVLVFWQTWCTVCKGEAPELVRAAKATSGRLHFFGVVSGTREDIDDAKVARTAEQWGLTYPTLRDRRLEWARRFRVKGTPTLVILGKAGEVLYYGHRPPKDWSVYASRAPESDAGR